MQTKLIPAYVYQQYADDTDIQAFNTAFNQLAQEYITWFSTVGLPIYTGLSGALLDWIATGLYGISRPVLTNGVITPASLGTLYGEVLYGLNRYGTPIIGTPPVPAPFYYVNDDIYKRIITWRFYKGDGFMFSIPWLKRRIARFLNGVNGTAPNIDNTDNISVVMNNVHVVTITLVASGATTILNGQYGTVQYGKTEYGGFTSTTNTLPPSPITQYLANAIQSGILDLPFQYTYVVIQ